MFLPKNTMFPSNSIKKRENHTPMDMHLCPRKTYPHGHEHLCPRKRVLLTEYFGHKCLELRAQLCNVSGNIPRRLLLLPTLVAHGANPCD